MPETQPPRAILFDMDGVLIDSMIDHDQTFVLACRQYGFTKSEILGASKGTTTLPQLYGALQQFRSFPVSFEQFSDNILEHLFEALKERNITTDPELLTFLQEARDHGVKVGIATSAIRKSAVRKLALVELHREFDVMVCADDVEHPKPHPEPFLKLAELLGAEPQHCVVIGDSRTDITAGQAAGAKAIGFTKYLQDKTVLHEADLVVDSFAELSFDRLQQLLNR